MYELFKPKGYVQKEDCNGCGTGWSASLVPNTIYTLDIKPACCIHDFMYEIGQTIEDKEEADRVFLNNMIRIVNAKKSWWFPHFLARSRALNYYNAVTNFGGEAFWKEKK